MATVTTTGETAGLNGNGSASSNPLSLRAADVPQTSKNIMARFWYSCAVFCAAALLLPLLTQHLADDRSGEDPEAEEGTAGPSQSLQLGVTFFAIAVMVWTFIAAWFCYNSPLLLSDVSLGRGKQGLEAAQLDVSRSVLQRVAQGFADFIVENSKREDRMGCNGEATTSLRGLDLAKFEELVAVAPAAAASALYGYKGTTTPTPKEMFTKECSSCSKLSGCAPDVCGGNGDPTTVPQLDAPHLSLFKELLRDRLVANLMFQFEGGQKLGEGGEGSNWLGGNLRLPSRWFAASSEPQLSQGVGDELEKLLWELLWSSGEILPDESSGALGENRKDDVPFAASMADHARAIGDKCFKEEQFVAAVHCYEVATLLCPGPSSPFREQLASGHCNCALACLKLRRYGDAISECHAALVLVPSMQLTLKTLHRLAAAHVCLKNSWEAVRCLRNCLDLEPDNVHVQKLLHAVESSVSSEKEVIEDRSELVWADLCIQGGRDKARRRRKKKCGSERDAERHLDREAGLWHSVVAQNSKLYIFGGLPSGRDADGADAPGAFGSFGPNQMDNSGGSEEFHVLDLETLEMAAGSKVPQPSYGHTATVVDNSMLVLGGSVDGVLVYDFLDCKWHSPATAAAGGVGPGRRQGHSATALESLQLCVYGGIELMEQGNGRVCNDAYLLDTESWTWQKLECTGIIPAARFGHTATQLPDASSLLVIGGRDQMTSCRDLVRDHSGLHILDVAKHAWSEQTFSGTPPEKVFGHFACLWTPRSLLLVSGEAIDKPQAPGGVELFLLDLEKWCWSQPGVQGAAPPCRLGMAGAALGCLGADAVNERRLYLFGGVVLRGEQVVVDKTVYMLETVEAKDAKAAAAAKELDDAPAVELDNEVEQEITAFPEIPTELVGDIPTDLPDEGDQNEEVEDEPELSFEELLEQEKAFFKLQSKKTSFPRSQVAEVRRKDNRQGKKSGQKSG